MRIGTTRANRLAYAAAVALLVALSGGVGLRATSPALAAPGSTATFEATTCPFALPTFLAEGENVGCGYVTVPLFHRNPTAGTIRLAVATLSSTGMRPSDVPLVLLNGGPGQPSEPILPGFDPALADQGSLAPLLERQDVIVFDQRGTGYSEPGLYCGSDIPPTPADNETTVEGGPGGSPHEPSAVADVADDSAVAEASACRDALAAEGIDLEAYTTAENAADVEDVRVALGHDRIDLLGISYGSRLALDVMRDSPYGVRSVILDAPLPPQVDPLPGQLIGFDAALDRLFAGCAADPGCDRVYPDLERTFLDALVALEADPLPVTYRDATTGEDVGLLVDGETFVSVVYFSVFVGPLLPYAPPLITTTAARSADLVEAFLPFVESFGDGFSTGMRLAIFCQDEVPFSSLAAARSAVAAAGVRPELASGFGLDDLDSYAACDALGLEPEDAMENAPVTSDIPTLVMTGAYDPITPTGYGALALETLPNGTLVDFGNAGHDPLGTAGPCAVGIAVAFLDDPTAEVDASCADELAVDFSP